MRFLIFVFIIQSGIVSNAQIANEIYVGSDMKNKYEYNSVLLPSKYVINRINDAEGLFDTPPLNFFLGLMFKEKYGIELGYFKEFYSPSIFTMTPDDVLCGRSTSVDLLHNYYLKVNYMLYKYKKFSIYPELSFIYGNATYWDGLPLGGSGPGCIDMYIKEYYEKGIDWGLHKYYLFLNGDLKIDYRFKKKYSLTASVGYNQGFKTMGYARGYYIYKDEPKQYFKNDTKGSNYYFTIGLKYHYKVKPKQEDTLIEKGNRKYLWDNNFHFYAGIISSLDIIDDNLSVKYMPKFGVSFEVRKNRLAISSNLYYLNRSIIYYDIFTNNSLYDRVNNTSSILDIYIKFKGAEINQALNYYYFYSKKIDLYGGLGYFRLSFKLNRNQYELEHSDGYTEVHFDYLRYTYHKSGWLLNLGGVYKINKKLRLNACFNVNNIDMYRKITRIVLLHSEQKKHLVSSYNLKIEYDL